jgi:hypothetical protein
MPTPAVKLARHWKCQIGLAWALVIITSGFHVSVVRAQESPQDNTACKVRPSGPRSFLIGDGRKTGPCCPTLELSASRWMTSNTYVFQNRACLQLNLSCTTTVQKYRAGWYHRRAARHYRSSSIIGNQSSSLLTSAPSLISRSGEPWPPLISGAIQAPNNRNRTLPAFPQKS